MKKVLSACPLDCPDACSWVVTVDDDGAAASLRGNPEHPVTRGACRLARRMGLTEPSL